MPPKDMKRWLAMEHEDFSSVPKTPGKKTRYDGAWL